jgi:putative oxygen-independent coproporphyrinogen III oxidase
MDPSATSRTSSPDRWLTDPLECGPAAGFGVYLHVPFCHHRCGYCDFATTAVGEHGPADVEALYRRYVAALRTDLGRQVEAGRAALGAPDSPPGRGATAADPGRGPDPGTGWPLVTSVFVGGGTPTLLPADLLVRVVTAVREELDVAGDAEITVECNPETASVGLFTALADAGVGRVSMGAQSFAPHVLRTLERGHTPDRPLQAVEEARAGGIAQVSLDLIFGTPGETAEDWRRTLSTVLTAGTDHVSAYALTLHANTPFGRRVRRGELAAPDDDVARDRFEVAGEMLGAGGFEHYELSNWALGPHRRSAHNVLYWRHGDYLGVGVGAHGHLSGRRWWSTRSTERYLEAIESGASPVAGDEVLDDTERGVERLLLGLRLQEGLHPFDVPPIQPLALEEAMAAGLVSTSCGRLQCTEEGWFLLDEAVTRLS